MIIIFATLIKEFTLWLEYFLFILFSSLLLRTIRLYILYNYALFYTVNLGLGKLLGR